MGIASATVKGGVWPEYGVNTLTSIQGSGFHRRQIAKHLGAKGMMDERALLSSLNGVAPGAATSKTLSRIANSDELGGKRTVETETLINRVSAAGDVTAIAGDLLAYSTKTTMASPANKDGNPLGTR